MTTDRAALAAEFVDRLLSQDERRPPLEAFLRLGAEGARGALLALGRMDPYLRAFLRNDAAASLRALGEDGRAAILAGLEDRRTRLAAVWLLDVLGPEEFAGHLRAALADTSREIRAAAAAVLEARTADGFDASPFGAALVPLVAEQCTAAIRVLGRLRPSPDGALTAIRRALRSGTADVRTDAAGALFRLTGEVDAALAAFRSVFSEAPEADRWERIGTYVEEMGTRAAPIAATLNEAILGGGLSYGLVRAIGALGEGAAPALPALRAAIAGDLDSGGHPYRDLEPDDYLVGVEAARRLGPVARAALPELHELLDAEVIAIIAGRDGREREFATAVRRAITAVQGE